MNNDNDNPITLNDKYLEFKVDCPGKLTPSDFNAFLRKPS